MLGNQFASISLPKCEVLICDKLRFAMVIYGQRHCCVNFTEVFVLGSVSVLLKKFGHVCSKCTLHNHDNHYIMFNFYLIFI